MSPKEITHLVKKRVTKYYWQLDKNCAVTTLYILAEVFEIKINGQTADAAIGMHGVGRYGAQCGLVEGTLMFLGIFGKQNNLPDKVVVDACRNFAKQFESEFGSLKCGVLRPQGFRSDNPPHLCEQITCRAIEFAINHISSFKGD